jgi:uncharacterized membrane protein YjgN (DUF898 family)
MEGQSDIPPVPPAGSVPSAGAVPIASGPVKRLTYDGRLGELYRIFLVNLGLFIVTLGIYRFWGKTRMRRYLWSRLSYDGDRFEYTGTGGEMFRGFLIVAGVLLVVGLMLGVSELVFATIFAGDPMKGQFASLGLTYLLYIVLGYLLLTGQYMALRYRLSRSRWRGIRGGLAGSPWAYGATAFAWMLAVGASLGFARPVADVSLARMRLRNLFFGTVQAKLDPDGGTGGLYGPYIASWFAIVFGFLVFAALYGGLIAVIGISDALAPYLIERNFGEPPDVERMLKDTAVWWFFARMMVVVVLAATLGWMIILFFRSWYWAVLGNRIGQMTELAGLRFAPTLRMGSLGRLVAGNLLIAVCTLGFGTPIVLHRTWRFLAANMQVVGELDGATIGQSRLAVPGRGEGLLEALDAGGAF